MYASYEIFFFELMMPWRGILEMALLEPARSYC